MVAFPFAEKVRSVCQVNPETDVCGRNIGYYCSKPNGNNVRVVTLSPSYPIHLEVLSYALHYAQRDRFSHCGTEASGAMLKIVVDEFNASDKIPTVGRLPCAKTPGL